MKIKLLPIVYIENAFWSHEKRGYERPPVKPELVGGLILINYLMTEKIIYDRPSWGCSLPELLNRPTTDGQYLTANYTRKTYFKGIKTLIIKDLAVRDKAEVTPFLLFA